MGRKLNQLDQFRLRDEHHPRNERYGAEEHFTGTLPERTRTDRCNILTFIVVLLGVVPLAALCNSFGLYISLIQSFIQHALRHSSIDSLVSLIFELITAEEINSLQNRIFTWLIQSTTDLLVSALTNARIKT